MLPLASLINIQLVKCKSGMASKILPTLISCRFTKIFRRMFPLYSNGSRYVQTSYESRARAYNTKQCARVRDMKDMEVLRG